MADYDIELYYHPSKINVMLDVLSRKPEDNMSKQLTQQKKLLRELVWLDLMVIQGTGESG